MKVVELIKKLAGYSFALCVLIYVVPYFFAKTFELEFDPAGCIATWAAIGVVVDIFYLMNRK